MNLAQRIVLIAYAFALSCLGIIFVPWYASRLDKTVYAPIWHKVTIKIWDYWHINYNLYETTIDITRLLITLTLLTFILAAVFFALSSPKKRMSVHE